MSKKPERKEQTEPPAEQSQSDEQYRPMAVPEPNVEKRLEALEIRLKITEDWTNKHNRYHYGKEISEE